MASYRWLFIYFLWGGALLSCGRNFNPKDAEIVSLDQLKSYVYGPIGYYSTVFKGVFYLGSDDDFDYIAISHQDNIATFFRVRHRELVITNRMPVERNAEKWANITKEFPFPQSGSRPQ